MMESAFKYHVFLAHAASDTLTARKLYRLLIPKYKVFLDSETLKPGDRWNREIPKAQRESLVTLILITQGTERAYFEQEEILAAIDLARLDEDHHRVVPIYLGHTEIPEDVPYGLRQLHAIFVKKRGGIKETSLQIKNLLRRIERLKRTPNVSTRRLIEKEKQILMVEREISRAIGDFRRRRKSISMIFGDIDKFTALNMKYGAEVGDKIIHIVGELFSQIPSAHYSGRLGGDEFVACLVGIKDADVRVVAEDLLERIRNYPWTRLSPELYLSISIGIAKLTLDEPIQKLLLRAVHGSVLAKRLGGNKVAEEGRIPLLKAKKREYVDVDMTEYIKEIARNTS
jgi:diguanylate cyclase (GGDEF)-like protein